MIKAVTRKAKSFWATPVFTKLWLVPVWLLLGLARMLVLLVPFRKIAPLLGRDAGTAALIPLLRPAQQARALLIGRTIRLAARYAPWQANCFAQAIVGAFLLRLYGLPYSVFFGLRRAVAPAGGMDAHAWTASGKIAVTGGSCFDRFTVVGVFTR